METFPAILLTGARQTGKTTLLRTEFGGTHRYVSLERPDVRERAAADPVSFLAEDDSPVILDEIQHVPGLLHYIKDRIDENREPGRWLMSGSQSFSLMKGISQTLAGRAAVLDLDPLSVAEVEGRPVAEGFDELLEQVLNAKSEPAPSGVALEDWVLRGGFPEIRANPKVDRQLWFSSYVQTYLERDVRDLTQVADLGTFSRFLAMIGARTGMVLNLAEVAREVGVAAPTAKRWLSVLETNQLVLLLPPYYKNFGKRIRRTPKLYLLDTGLATFLLGLHTAESVLQGPSLGALVETAVVCEWWKASRQRGERPNLYYWQPAKGMEVNLIIERGGRLHGVEVKSTATPTPRHAEGLVRWMELAGERTRGVLACRVGAAQALRSGVRAVPWYLLG